MERCIIDSIHALLFRVCHNPTELRRILAVRYDFVDCRCVADHYLFPDSQNT